MPTHLVLTPFKDSARYQASNLCGKGIEIINNANGKKVSATVADECPTCDNANSVDMSLACFEALADLNVGLLDITWQFT
jgi:hypothetical protein